jgi:hypothetical protein
MLKILLTMLLMLVGSGESPGDPLQSAVRQIADQISHPSSRPPTMYAPTLLDAISEEQLAAIYSSLEQRYGPVLGVTAASPPSPLAGQFVLEFRDVQITMTLHLEEGGEHRVDGLWFGPARPKLSSLADVAARLAALPGNVSFQLQCLDTGQVLASVHPEKTMAIGSSFKLYLLETLVRNKVAWDRLVVLQDRYKSLPTGELRTWPAGSPLTVHTLAADMISNSDNTAADHLLALEGRGAVEAILPHLGMANPGLDTPFLNTRELFQMRANRDLLSTYLSEGLSNSDLAAGRDCASRMVRQRRRFVQAASPDGPGRRPNGVFDPGDQSRAALPGRQVFLHRIQGRLRAGGTQYDLAASFALGSPLCPHSELE